MSTYKCPTHHTWQDGWCPQCVTDMDNARDPKLMTGDGRAAEMERWKIATVPFERIHQRLQALVGHPIQTLAFALMWDELVSEARNRKFGDGPQTDFDEPATIEALVTKLHESKAANATSPADDSADVIVIVPAVSEPEE